MKAVLQKIGRIIPAVALAAGLSVPAGIPLIECLPASAAEVAVQPEKNPPGDIPDTQVFIDYVAPQGFTLKVPEGWARSDRTDGASFVDKLDGVVVSVSKAGAAPTTSSTKANYLPELEKTERAVKVTGIKAVKLPAGPAVRIAYTSNSEPNAVTSRQVRLENERYLYFKDGKLVTLELYAPKGADNVDQWKMMSNSFRWK
jgi:hypothetical protein